MNNRIKFFCGVLLVIVLGAWLKTDKAYAYTIDDLGSYIENPEWFDNQKGRSGDNIGTYKIVKEDRPTINSSTVYFYGKNETYQLLIRQYDETAKIDFDNDDFKWFVMDERICTVDENGLLTAGEMTGVTTVLAENDFGYTEVAVVNLTGDYDDWYEKMFTGIAFGDYTTYHDKTDTEAKISAWNTARGHGNAYKIIVDAYLEYGEELYSNSKVRYKIVKEAVSSAAYGGSYTNIYGIFSDIDREQKCIYSNDFFFLLLMDGKIYELDSWSGFREIADESDGVWKNGNFYYVHTYQHIVNPSKIEWLKSEVKFTYKRNYCYTYDKDIIEEKIKPRFTHTETGDVGFVYELKDDRSVGAISLVEVPETYSRIVIPEYVNGVKVTAIDENGFEYWDMTGVEIPDSVTSIGGWAFFYCMSLENVVIPENVISIGQRAFLGCSSLKSVTIPESVAEIGTDAFAECPEDIVFIIKRGSFAEEWLKKKKFEDNIKYVE